MNMKHDCVWCNGSHKWLLCSVASEKCIEIILQWMSRRDSTRLAHDNLVAADRLSALLKAIFCMHPGVVRSSSQGTRNVVCGKNWNLLCMRFSGISEITAIVSKFLDRNCTQFHPNKLYSSGRCAVTISQILIGDRWILIDFVRSLNWISFE